MCNQTLIHFNCSVCEFNLTYCMCITPFIHVSLNIYKYIKGDDRQKKNRTVFTTPTLSSL